MTRRSRRRYLVLVAVLIVVAAVAAFKAHGNVGPAAQAAALAPAVAPVPSLTVSVERIRSETIASSISATGTVAAWQEATIGAQASGLQLIEVPVSEGDHVRAGEVVARLDASLLKAELAQQKAAVSQAQATLDTAISAAARADRLMASNAISAETAEERGTTVKTSRAQLEQAQAAADKLQAEIDQTTILAPFDGIVSSRPAVTGSIVQSGTQLMKIIRDGKLEVGALVPEKDLPAIQVGQAATVVDAAGRGSQGQVSSIAQTVNSTTRLATVYVSLGDGSGLRPGMFARVSIQTATSRQLSVAEAAIVWRDGKPAVFVVDEAGKVRARSIEIGARQNGRVAVASGLSQDDSVVIAGAGFLNDGNLVRIATAEADAGDSAAATGAVR